MANTQAKPRQNGYVTNHAPNIPRTTPKLIAVKPLVAPTPMIALLAVCVVLTGSPILEASSITVAAATLAEKPLAGWSLVIFVPKV